MRLGRVVLRPGRGHPRRQAVRVGRVGRFADHRPGRRLFGQDPGRRQVLRAIRESSYGAGANYRLHVGQFPRPTAVIPAGGKPGEEVAFRFIGDPLGEFTQTIKLPANDPKFRLAQTKEGIHPAGIPVRVVDLANVVESGTNVDIATATAGPTPAAFHGVVAKADEKDFFKFTAKKGQQTPDRLPGQGRRLAARPGD